MQLAAIAGDNRYTFRLHVQTFTTDSFDPNAVKWSVLRRDRVLFVGDHTPIGSGRTIRALTNNPDQRLLELMFWLSLPPDRVAPYGFENRYSTGGRFYAMTDPEREFRRAYRASIRRCLDSMYWDQPFRPEDMEMARPEDTTTED